MGTLPGPRRPGEVVRYTAGFARRTHVTLLRLHREFGPVVGFGFGSMRIVAGFGREANEQVLAHDERFRWREAFESMTPLRLLGHDVAPGSLLMISPLVTHRSPHVWHRPDRFVPDRWLDGPRPGPAEYLPFGGGAHRCLGAALAVTELKTMVARLVARVDLELVSRPVRPISYIAMRPRDGVPVRVTAVRADR